MFKLTYSNLDRTFILPRNPFCVSKILFCAQFWDISQKIAVSLIHMYLASCLRSVFDTCIEREGLLAAKLDICQLLTRSSMIFSSSPAYSGPLCRRTVFCLLKLVILPAAPQKIDP